jgi:hypothetical protein
MNKLDVLKQFIGLHNKTRALFLSVLLSVGCNAYTLYFYTDLLFPIWVIALAGILPIGISSCSTHYLKNPVSELQIIRMNVSLHTVRQSLISNTSATKLCTAITGFASIAIQPGVVHKLILNN